MGDPHEACKDRYPLRKVLFLVICAVIAGCLDGKTLRRSDDAAAGQPPLYLERLDVDGALVTIDAIATNPASVTASTNQSWLRKGHGARNMALVRRLAFNLVRAGKGKRSIKTEKPPNGTPTSSHPSRVNLDSSPCNARPPPLDKIS